LRDKNNLFSLINNKLHKTRKTYLFLDEIQEVLGFEDIINSLLHKNVDIYLTGSNSKMLSSELSTYLTERYLLFEVFPFSFKEYLDYHKPNNIDTAFLDFITTAAYRRYKLLKLVAIKRVY